MEKDGQKGRKAKRRVYAGTPMPTRDPVLLPTGDKK